MELARLSRFSIRVPRLRWRPGRGQCSQWTLPQTAMPENVFQPIVISVGKLWPRIVFLIATICIWSVLIEYYAAGRMEMHAANYMMTVAFVYGGLLVRRRSFSMGHILFATAWIAILLVLEKHDVNRFGFKVVLMGYLRQIPPAVMSLFLLWAIVGARTTGLHCGFASLGPRPSHSPQLNTWYSQSAI